MKDILHKTTNTEGKQDKREKKRTEAILMEKKMDWGPPRHR